MLHFKILLGLYQVHNINRFLLKNQVTIILCMYIFDISSKQYIIVNYNLQTYLKYIFLNT